jgi:hypothetical protein
VVRRGWASRGAWLLRRCSGVAGGDWAGEEGARVGEDVVEDGGRVAGSNSRSGIGGLTSGLCVIRRRRKRRIALRKGQMFTGTADAGK